MLGRVLEATKKLDQAIAEYNLARRPPVEGEAQLGRARILVRMGATKDALPSWRRWPRIRSCARRRCLLDRRLLRRSAAGGSRAPLVRRRGARGAGRRARRRSSSGARTTTPARRHDAIAQLDRAVKLGGDKAPLCGARRSCCSVTRIARATRTKRRSRPTSATSSWRRRTRRRAPRCRSTSRPRGRLMERARANSRPGGVQETMRMARSGARILKNAGFSGARFGSRDDCLGDGLKTARDARRGIKGGSAIIHLHALTDPLRPAIVDGEVRLNYGELEERVNRLTHGLRALGIGPGERIGAFLLQRARVPRADRGAQRRSAAPVGADRLSAQGRRGRLHPRELGRARDDVPLATSRRSSRRR